VFARWRTIDDNNERYVEAFESALSRVQTFNDAHGWAPVGSQKQGKNAPKTPKKGTLVVQPMNETSVFGSYE
jgi:hypothetical protein